MRKIGLYAGLVVLANYRHRNTNKTLILESNMFDTDIWIKHMAMAVVRQISLRRQRPVREPNREAADLMHHYLTV